MSQRKLPYLFLLILIIILIFVGGVKYGQKVEQANKVIKYVLSITPTPIKPTAIPNGFKMFTDDRCGIAFLMPDNLSTRYDISGMLPPEWINASKETEITYWCETYGEIPEGGLITVIPTYTPKVAFEKFYDIPLTATDSMMLNSKKITYYKSTIKSGLIAIKFIHPISGKFIGISISKRLYPLLKQTLQLMPAESQTPTLKPKETGIISPTR